MKKKITGDEMQSLMNDIQEEADTEELEFIYIDQAWENELLARAAIGVQDPYKLTKRGYLTKGAFHYCGREGCWDLGAIHTEPKETVEHLCINCMEKTIEGEAIPFYTFRRIELLKKMCKKLTNLYWDYVEKSANV